MAGLIKPAAAPVCLIEHRLSDGIWWSLEPRRILPIRNLNRDNSAGANIGAPPGPSGGQEIAANGKVAVFHALD